MKETDYKIGQPVRRYMENIYLQYKNSFPYTSFGQNTAAFYDKRSLFPMICIY